MWADTRISPRASSVALQEREELETLFNRRYEWPRLDSPPGDEYEDSASAIASVARLAGREDAGEQPNQIPILPAGADPDRYRRRPLGYLDRVAIERLIAGRAELIRPVAYELSDDDFERLRRVAHPHGRPLHALVSRPAQVEIDPREPYAVRFDGEVILAYCAWDGRELVVLQPPGHAGYARLKARSQAALSDYIVGQVVTLNWWEPSDTDSRSSKPQRET
jgi:hypothetical protein